MSTLPTTGTTRPWTVRTTPDLLRSDGTTAAIVYDQDGGVTDVLSLPYVEDQAAWDAAADEVLEAAMLARAGAWRHDGTTGELVATVVRLVRARLHDGGPVVQVVDFDEAVRREYGRPDILLAIAQDFGSVRAYDVLAPTREPDTWHRLGSAFLYD